MKKFKVSKAGKYFDVAYIGYVSDLNEFKFPCFGSHWFDTSESARKYIKYVNDLEVELDKIDKEHDTKKIIRFYLTTIESIVSGLDVRSSMSIEEVAQLLVNNFTSLYKRTLKECEETRQDVIGGKIHNNINDCRLVERYADKNEIFEFGLESLDGYFKEPPFSDLLDEANNFLDEMIKTRKSN